MNHQVRNHVLVCRHPAFSLFQQNSTHLGFSSSLWTRQSGNSFHWTLKYSSTCQAHHDQFPCSRNDRVVVISWHWSDWSSVHSLKSQWAQTIQLYCSSLAGMFNWSDTLDQNQFLYHSWTLSQPFCKQHHLLNSKQLQASCLVSYFKVPTLIRCHKLLSNPVWSFWNINSKSTTIRPSFILWHTWSLIELVLKWTSSLFFFFFCRPGHVTIVLAAPHHLQFSFPVHEPWEGDGEERHGHTAGSV